MNIARLLFAGLVVIYGAVAIQAATLALVAGGQEEKEPVAAKDAKLLAPIGIDVNRDGVLYFVEMEGQRVRSIDSGGILRTFAGTGKKGSAGDGGPALSAQFSGLHSLAIARNGDIYVADTGNNRVRKIDAGSRTVTPFAGTGRKGFSGDGGPAAAAEFGGVYCVAFNPAGDRLYLADLDNRRIRFVDMATGIVETLAGNGERGAPEEGSQAKLSPLVDPRAVAADNRGNVYVLERAGNALRVVDAQGRIRTVIGGGTSACRDEQGHEPIPLKGPKHLCLDQDGNVLIADSDNHLVRKYIPAEKRLVRVAGTARAGAEGVGGPPLAAQLFQPHGVYVDASGILYIADSSNNRLLKVVP